MNGIKTCLFLVLILFSSVIFSQTENTQIIDSNKIKKDILLDSQNKKVQINDTSKVKDIHLRNAVILSTVLPGSGQIYNHFRMPKGKKKGFWKVPLIYAALGGTGYYYIKNQQLKRSYKNEYLSREAGNDPAEGFESYDSYSLLSLHDQYENRRNLFFIGLALVYILQITDAAVEAHFVHYDLNPNLSLQIKPEIINIERNFQMACSLQIQFQLKDKSQRKEKVVSLFN
ncbi:MAG: hypothetical protein HYU67_10470 [Flavobacteriia bacterium]|nr:hypothetical protein [Flavobacteriia bacterium]